MQSGKITSSPFEVPVTQRILQKHIEAGDISQDDIDIIRKGYSWMAMSSFLGSTACGLGTYYALRRRKPPMPLGMKLLVAGGMGMLGSFVGFTVGGAAAAMEVSKRMQDSERKLQVFAEIAEESREEYIKQRMAGSSSGPSAAGIPPIAGQRQQARTAEPTWDVEGTEKRMEDDRQRDYTSDLGQIQSDAEFAKGEGEGNSRQERASGTKEIARATRGTWDRLRQEAFPAQTQAQQSPSPSPEPNTSKDTRTAEQKEFDAMLERERSGDVTKDKWA